MAIRYNKKLVIIMIMLILFSCTSCGVKQNTDKQEVKKKITWEGDYPYANSTDIFCVEKNNLFSYDINGENKRKLVLCQDLVQVKMRNFSHFNLPKAQP